MTDGTCSVAGCDEPILIKQRGWCRRHYQRWQRHGDPEGSDPNRTDLTGQKFAKLTVVGFDKERGEWLCRCDCGRTTHARRAWLTRAKKVSCGTPGPCHWRTPHVSYGGVHRRLQRTRGPARNQACVDCGGAAHHWSYDHSDPNEVFETQRGIEIPYSLDIERYVARCRSCHRRHDLARHAETCATTLQT